MSPSGEIGAAIKPQNRPFVATVHEDGRPEAPFCSDLMQTAEIFAPGECVDAGSAAAPAFVCLHKFVAQKMHFRCGALGERGAYHDDVTTNPSTRP